MSITFREIVEVLGLDAPIHFTPKEQLNKANYTYFHIASTDDPTQWRCQTDTAYDPQRFGVHLPDLEAEEYYRLEAERNPAAMDCREQLISNQMILFLSERPVIFSVFCVLHEYGHYLHFLSSGKTAQEFCIEETNARKPYQSQIDAIYQMPDCDPRKIIYARKLDSEVYSQFPSEKAANQYALESIEAAMDQIWDHLGYTFQDLIAKNCSSD